MMFTPFEAGLFVSCIMLAIFLAFAFGFSQGSESAKKRVFKILTDNSDPWNALDEIREEVTGE